MKIKIKVTEDNYFIKLMMILNNLPPFDRLRPQELILYSHLLRVNHKYRNIPLKERNKLIFNYEVKQDIASRMGIKSIGVYNIISRLKNLDLLDKDGLIPKYTLGKARELLFVFEEDE